MSSIAKTRPLYLRKTWDVLLAAFSFVSIFIALGGMIWILFTVFGHGWQMVSPLRNLDAPVAEAAAQSAEEDPYAYEDEFAYEDDTTSSAATPAVPAKEDGMSFELGGSTYQPTVSFFTNPTRPVDSPEKEAETLELMHMIDHTLTLDPVGIGNAVMGTLAITFMAALITVPLAMCAGIYLSEFGKGSKFANFLRFSANVLMGVPSILIGVFIYTVLVVPMGGVSGFAGSIALSILMFPVIMRTTEDMMAMVPNTLRESALALGMTRMRTTLCIIARAAKNGLATGVLLSLARVSGETAPLLFTVMFSDQWPAFKTFFTQPMATLPVTIYRYTMDFANVESYNVGWGAALVVCALILLVNIATRYFFRDAHKR